MQIAPMLNGRIDIKYRRVECTPPVPVKVQIDGNSGTGGWLRLAVTVSCWHYTDFSGTMMGKTCLQAMYAFQARQFLHVEYEALCCFVVADLQSMRHCAVWLAAAANCVYAVCL